MLILAISLEIVTFILLQPLHQNCQAQTKHFPEREQVLSTKKDQSIDIKNQNNGENDTSEDLHILEVLN